MDIEIISTVPIYELGDKSFDDFFDDSVHLLEFGSHGPYLGISKPAFNDMVSHANTSLSDEVGGLCLGHAALCSHDIDPLNPKRLLIFIKTIVTAEHTLTGAIMDDKPYLTFTADSWRDMIDIHLRYFSDQWVLGWYHSHPQSGIELSSLDKFIHNNFFWRPWHVAVVIDLRQKLTGFFARHGGKLLLEKLPYK